MTSMSRVATDGSVSGSKLVTMNMLLGLDNGWMMGRGTEKEKERLQDQIQRRCGVITVKTGKDLRIRWRTSRNERFAG